MSLEVVVWAFSSSVIMHRPHFSLSEEGNVNFLGQFKSEHQGIYTRNTELSLLLQRFTLISSWHV